MRFYRNKKSGKMYVFLGVAINCTNDMDGDLMVLYREDGVFDTEFVRESTEFYSKFEEVV